MRPERTIRIPREAQFVTPSARAAWPSGSPGILCSASAKSGAISSKCGSARIFSAPDPSSSAGWNSSTARPFSGRFRPSQRATPARMAICPSWPHTMRLAGDLRAMRRSAGFRDGQGVEFTAYEKRRSTGISVIDRHHAVSTKAREHTVRRGWVPACRQPGAQYRSPHPTVPDADATRGAMQSVSAISSSHKSAGAFDACVRVIPLASSHRIGPFIERHPFDHVIEACG